MQWTSFNEKIKQIKIFGSWNCHPTFLRNDIIKRFLQKKTSIHQDQDIDINKIWIRLSN